MVRTARVTCLVDESSAHPDLRAEHGLCLWLELDGAKILFDTGQSDASCLNARFLGADLPRADAIVLSHGRYDHTGGLVRVLEFARRARVFAHPAALEPKFACDKGKQPRAIGMPPASRAALSVLGDLFVLTEHPTEVIPGVWVTGEVPRPHDWEDVGGPFYRDEAGRLPDRLPDDQALFFRVAAGVVVVMGCAHAGPVNTLEYVARLSGENRVHAVIGGLHLGRAGAARLKATAEALERWGVGLLAPCHCTGEAARGFLARRFGGRFVRCGTGTSFAVS